MKTIRMTRNFDYKPMSQVTIGYLRGAVYHRVPEAAVRVILKAKAGEIVHDGETIEAISQ